ncbi:MAG TPA: choice-of-anchor E domain-containing protein [Verrucomicrobiae bacterium]|nr:choice-of-anchor E domain-containing protein [Verrucomicrobiae bacterium]
MLCGLANLAHGAISTITVSAMLSPQAADFSNQPLSFQQFDPGLGKLQSVRVIVRSTIQLSQQFENTSDQDQAIHSRQTLDLVLDLPDGTTPAVKDRQVVARTYSADAFDGDIDFDGTSGSTTDYEITSSNQKLLKSRAKVAMFTGSGLANLFLSADGTFTASNKQNQLVAQAQALAGVEVQIIYNYIAVVPEPVAYGLAAGVLAFFPIIGLRLRKSGRGWIRQ